MNNPYQTTTLVASSLLLFLALSPIAQAQILPDNSLPNNSTVTPNGRGFQIDGGTTAGSDLFHSFQEFSVPTGNEAFFNNATNINNIITRVTGGNISNIDGLIRANGTANLFLLNPNGIIFGPNARLDIGGSFLGTTADSILFDDGREFSATPPHSPPLLTVNVPVGLQFGSGAGAIQVAGEIAPADGTGLELSPGRTLALVGGDVTLTGAIVEVPSGRVEIGSVRSGEVGLTPTTVGWKLGYDDAIAFGDIELRDGTSVSTPILENHPDSGIQLRGDRILLDRSAIASVTLGNAPGGDITIEASESLELYGTGDRFPFSSSIATQVDEAASGSGGQIAVSASRITLSESSKIQTATFGSGVAGDLNVNADETVEILGFNPALLDDPFESAAQLSSFTFGEADTGSITVSTRCLIVTDGALLLPGILFGATGNGGDLNVSATDTIEVRGVSPVLPSVIETVTFDAGNGGNIFINTGRLVVRDGGQVSADTGAAGSAGRTTIRAAASIVVSGINPSGEAAEISADAFIPDPGLQQAFSLPPVPTGNTGELTIRTPRLEVSAGGSVAVEHEGIGNAGDLRIEAGAIALDEEGSITAATQSGGGGNLVVEVQDSLQLRNGSFISAEAGGTGHGGNLTISTDTLVALENSDIIANAFEGNGGNIQIQAQAIFGTQFRPQQTPESDITASSQFGVDGIVQITNPNIDSTQGLVELPEKPVNEGDRIVSGCASALENSLTVTGRGGLPPNPERQLISDRPWTDLRNLSVFRSESAASLPQENTPPRLVEANSWIVHPDGKIELVALVNNAPPQGLPLNCAVKP